MTPKTPTPTPEPKTRATPVPEPETAALRAVRNVRQLNEKHARIAAKADRAMVEVAAERDAIIAALSPEAKALFDKLAAMPKTKAAEPAKASEP
jgi:hypothetical protein